MLSTRPSPAGLNWWSVNIGSGNGLVPSGNKPLPEPMLTQISVTIRCHKATMTSLTKHSIQKFMHYNVVNLSLDDNGHFKDSFPLSIVRDSPSVLGIEAVSMARQCVGRKTWNTKYTLITRQSRFSGNINDKLKLPWWTLTEVQPA